MKNRKVCSLIQVLVLICIIVLLNVVILDTYFNEEGSNLSAMASYDEETIPELLYGYNTAPLNIRKSTDIKSEWMGQYPAFSTIIILEDLGEWYRAEKGYVKKVYVHESIEIDVEGMSLEETAIYALPDYNSDCIGTMKAGNVTRYIQKVNGFLEIFDGGFVCETAVTFEFLKTDCILENKLTADDIIYADMSNLPIQYIGTINKRTKATGVTTKKGLYFRDIIPIYDIIDEEAYFPSGRYIYKLPINSFSEIKNVGSNYEILAAYRTVYYSSSRNRKNNIELVASYVDSIEISPGEVFSFNKTTGPRSEQKGYKEAPVIANGTYVMDFGGGVCQVSSTIYAAIKNQETFKIIERRPHGLEVSYLPYGMDATVSYGSVDLKFMNNNNFSAMLNVFAANGVCLVLFTRDVYLNDICEVCNY